MDYEPRLFRKASIPRANTPCVNSSCLVGGISLVVVVLTLVLAASADFLLGYIPVEKENQWFSSDDAATSTDEGTSLEAEVEAYLQQLGERLLLSVPLRVPFQSESHRGFDAQCLRPAGGAHLRHLGPARSGRQRERAGHGSGARNGAPVSPAPATRSLGRVLSVFPRALVAMKDARRHRSRAVVRRQHRGADATEFQSRSGA